MNSPNRRKKPFKRYLKDFLRKPQQKCLDREFEIAAYLGAARWHFRLAPYPFDRDTAEAIQGIIDNQVLPWGVIETYVEEWAYPEFFEEAVAFEMTLNRRSREDAMAAVPDLERLRWCFYGVVPRSEVALADDFADEYKMLHSIIKDGLLVDEPSLAGKFVHMPFLPLGENWLSRVPLLDQVWIDRRIVELCEASALLFDEQYTHLPAADPHSLAWHRFFPAETRWTSPTMAPHSVFVDALNRAIAAIGKMQTRACHISGRPFVHIDDYAAWAARRGRDDLRRTGMQEGGIPWARWNAWVHENGNNGVVEVAGYRLSALVNKWDVSVGEGVQIYPSLDDADVAMGERLRAFDQLYSAAARLAPTELALSDMERRILRCLEGRAMTADDLCIELDCDRRTLYRPGGIKGLVSKGFVLKDRKVGGYYRPDFPPR